MPHTLRQRKLHRPIATDALDASGSLLARRGAPDGEASVGSDTDSRVERDARTASRARRTRSIRRTSATAHAHAIDWDALEPTSLYARSGRRLLDVALLAVTIAPVLAIGSAVALANLAAFRDPRKVLYVQPRVGRRGRIFHIYKFRTMRDPRRSAHESWASGQDAERVTRLGRFLRNSHFDELPQILNILKGEMSFIGPRPEMVEVERWAAEHVPGFTHRLVLKPGITGWAQVTQGYTGRCVEAYAEKLAITEQYKRRLSLRTDLSILARTVLWMARGKGWRWNHAERSQGEQV